MFAVVQFVFKQRITENIKNCLSSNNQEFSPHLFLNFQTRVIAIEDSVCAHFKAHVWGHTPRHVCRHTRDKRTACQLSCGGWGEFANRQRYTLQGATYRPWYTQLGIAAIYQTSGIRLIGRSSPQHFGQIADLFTSCVYSTVVRK